MEIHLALRGESLGSVSMQEFLFKANRGDYAPETLVWTEGEAGWVALAEFAKKYMHNFDPLKSHGIPTTKTTQAGPGATRQFFSELGAEVETYVRRCEALPQRDWVRWDDGHEEHFPLPVPANAGHKIAMLGVKASARVGVSPAMSREGAPLFTIPEDSGFCWCMVENATTKAMWSELDLWLDGFINEAGQSAVSYAQINGFDLEKASTDESRKPAYMAIAAFLPPLVAAGIGWLAYWGASFVLSKQLSLGLGIALGAFIFVNDLRTNIKRGVFKYSTVKEKRVKDVQDGIAVYSTKKKIKNFVTKSLIGA